MAQNYDRDRYFKDIEEVLKQAKASDLNRRQQRRPFVFARRFAIPDLRPRGPEHVMLAGLVLVILEWFRVTAFLGGAVGVLGVILLVIGFASLLIRPRTSRSYWRGRPIEFSYRAGWADRVYRWLYRQP
jgi:hypothetical protein